jgi:hypothetical protein
VGIRGGMEDCGQHAWDVMHTRAVGNGTCVRELGRKVLESY